MTDPFGHASGYANLASQMGFDAIFFARIDFADYAVRSAAQTLEYVWRPSASFGAQTQLFAHAMNRRGFFFQCILCIDMCVM